MPALLTRTSMRPDRPRTALTARVTEAASSTSRATRRIGSFSASTAAVSSVAVAGLRTPACTSWPSRAKWSAVARPMPLLLPVIRTTDMRPLYQIRRPRTASELSAPHRDDGHPDPERPAGRGPGQSRRVRQLEGDPGDPFGSGADGRDPARAARAQAGRQDLHAGGAPARGLTVSIA